MYILISKLSGYVQAKTRRRAASPHLVFQVLGDQAFPTAVDGKSYNLMILDMVGYGLSRFKLERLRERHSCGMTDDSDRYQCMWSRNRTALRCFSLSCASMETGSVHLMPDNTKEDRMELASNVVRERKETFEPPTTGV